MSSCIYISAHSLLQVLACRFSSLTLQWATFARLSSCQSSGPPFCQNFARLCPDGMGSFAVQCKRKLHLLMQCTLSTSAKSYFNRWDYLNLSGGRQPFCDFTLYRLSDIAPYSATGPPFRCLGYRIRSPGLTRSRSVLAGDRTRDL